MSKTRENYQLSANSVYELVAQLNFILQRISDRLDKIEGLRGESEVEQVLKVNDADGNNIHSLE